VLRQAEPEGFGKSRIRYKVGNMSGILYMRTSHGLFVAGEARKYFSILSDKLENGPASYSNDISEEKHLKNLNWFKNDEKYFERAVSSDALKKAWFSLKDKLNTLHVKTDQVTLSSLRDYWFVTTSRKLLKGSFKYPKCKRVMTNKLASGKTQFVILNPRIRIIERALLNAVEPLFEGYFQWLEISKEDFDSKSVDLQNKSYHRIIKTYDKCIYQEKRIVNSTVFSPHSYGFRPQKSGHQALKAVKHWRTNTSFFIEYEVSKTFDQINYKRLKNIFNKTVVDTRFWLEISKILKSGVILELEELFKCKKVNQGSILSPFLFNVYMNELDQKLASVQKITFENHKSYKSLTYGNKQAEVAYRKLSRDFATDNLRRALKRYGSKEAILNAYKIAFKEYHRRYIQDKSINTEVRSIQYIRYVNDLLIGIVGSREFAIQVRKDINNFLKSNLHFEVKKDILIHRSDDVATFLGYIIRIRDFRIKTSSRSKKIRAARKNKNKSISRFLESDKRIARAKSYQIYSKMLSQFSIMSNKLKMSLKNSKHTNDLSLFFAYHEIGITIMKSLNLRDWNQFVELLSVLNSSNYRAKDLRNPSIYRWISYLNIETKQLNELNSLILRDKLSFLAESSYSTEIFKEVVDKLKEAQENGLRKIIDIGKKPKNLIKELNMGRKFLPSLSKKKVEKLPLAKKLTIIDSNKFAFKQIYLNAPIGVIFTKLRVKGYIHPIKNKAIGNKNLGLYTDAEIVNHFNCIIYDLLNWFCGADNFSKIKGLGRLLRKSCILTLANKHNKNRSWVYIVYGGQIFVNDQKKEKRVTLIRKSEIVNYLNKFNLRIDNPSVKQFSLEKIAGGKYFKLGVE